MKFESAATAEASAEVSESSAEVTDPADGAATGRGRSLRRAYREAVFLGGLTVALAVVSACVDTVELVWNFSRAHEAWELDEIISMGLVLGVASLVFAVRRWLDLRHEVRERGKAEAAARTSRIRYQRLADGISDGLWVVNERAEITYGNAALARILGVDSPDALLDRPFFEFLHPDVVEETQAVFEANLAAGQACENLILPILRGDGSIGHVELSSNVIWREGLAVGFRSVLRDVSARVEGERALRESREMLSLVLDTIPAGVFWKTRDSVYAGCNKTMLDHFGLSGPNEIVGKTDEELPWREMAEAFRENDRYVMSTGLAHLDEDRIDGGDGEHLRLRSSKVPLRDADGEVVGVLGTYEDTTEEKRAGEERNRLVQAIEHLEEYVIVCDAEGRVTYVNRAFSEATGLAVDDASGLRLTHVLSRLGGPEWSRDLWARVSEGEKWKGRLRGRSSGDTDYLLEVLASPFRTESGEAAYVVVGLDVSREAALEDQLRQSQRLEAVGCLTGGIAHDFNNLLSVIISTTDLLELDVGENTTETVTNIRAIRTASEAASQLVRKLLGFSRKASLNVERLTLGEILRDNAEIIRIAVPESIDLSLDFGNRVAPALVDAGAVGQIVLNLVTNARDAMPDGGTLSVAVDEVQLDEEAVSAAPWMKSGRCVRLSVSDTGFGMDGETAERIFDPFFSTKPEGKGTGLGLSTVYGLTRQQDGMVKAHSRPNEGTTMEVYFPVTDGWARARKPVVPVGYVPDDPVTGTIVLVEDNDGVREVGRRMLEKAGFTVIVFRNGEEALRFLEQHSDEVTLVLSDIVMPRLSGWELFQRLREAGCRVPFVLTTGYGEEVEVGMEHVRDELPVLDKPWTFESLRETVRSEIVRHHAGRP